MKEHHSEHIGSIIEQWFKRFEFVAKDSAGLLDKGKTYPLGVCDLHEKQIGIEGPNGEWMFCRFDEVPDYFEIRIREA